MTSSRRLFAAAAACGVLAAVLAFAWFTTRERAFKSLSEPAPVLVAARHVPGGARIARPAVEVKLVPKAFHQPGALASPDDAVGQLALAPIAAGEQVLANKLTRGGVALALAVPPGKRAVSVGVDAPAGVAGLLKPGDLVDVFVTQEEGGGPRTQALMQAAPVLAVGRAFSNGPAAPEGDGAGLLDPEAANTVTLAASPLEAAQLTHLELAGRIKLVLRSPGDAERIPLPALTGRVVRPAAAREDEAVHRR